MITMLPPASATSSTSSSRRCRCSPGVLGVAALMALLLFFFGPRLVRGRARPRVRRGSRRWCSRALVIGGGAVAGRALYPSAPSAAVPPAVPAALADKPNLLLIVVDTLRADALSCYGGAGRSRRTICGVAKQGGTLFTGFSHASWTKPSFASILTSTLPSTHNAMSKTATLPPDLELVSEALQKHGYATGGIVSNINLAPSFGFQQGYDEYSYLSPDYLFGAEESSSKLIFYQIGRREVALKLKPGHRVDGLLPGRRNRRRASPSTGSTRTRTRASSCCSTTWIRTIPTSSTPTTARRSRACECRIPIPRRPSATRELYDGEIALHRRADRRAARAQLRRRGLYDDTLIVITADHGEEFQEHGGWWHGTTLYDEQIRVPLLVKWPKGKVGAPARARTPVRHIDIAPTLLARAGRRRPRCRATISRARRRTRRDGAHAYAEEDHEGNVLRAIRTRTGS